MYTEIIKIDKSGCYDYHMITLVSNNGNIILTISPSASSSIYGVNKICYISGCKEYVCFCYNENIEQIKNEMLQKIPSIEKQDIQDIDDEINNLIIEKNKCINNYKHTYNDPKFKKVIREQKLERILK